MKRKNCMKRKYMFMALLCYALTTAAQDASHNYVRTRSMLDETGGKYLDKVEYFYGRKDASRCHSCRAHCS